MRPYRGVYLAVALSVLPRITQRPRLSTTPTPTGWVAIYQLNMGPANCAFSLPRAHPGSHPVHHSSSLERASFLSQWISWTGAARQIIRRQPLRNPPTFGVFLTRFVSHTRRRCFTLKDLPRHDPPMAAHGSRPCLSLPSPLATRDSAVVQDITSLCSHLTHTPPPSRFTRLMSSATHNEVTLCAWKGGYFPRVFQRLIPSHMKSRARMCERGNTPNCQTSAVCIYWWHLPP
jgi:hypothetical protein